MNDLSLQPIRGTIFVSAYCENKAPKRLLARFCVETPLTHKHQQHLETVAASSLEKEEMKTDGRLYYNKTRYRKKRRLTSPTLVLTIRTHALQGRHKKKGKQSP